MQPRRWIDIDPPFEIKSGQPYTIDFDESGDVTIVHGKALTDTWHLSGDPWYSGDTVGTVILAGSPDPHVATIVADCLPEMVLLNLDGEKTANAVAQARLIAQWIVESHNADLNDPEG